MLRVDWRKSDSRWGATGELDLEFKFPRRGCKLSFFFPPCHQSGLGIVQCLFNLSSTSLGVCLGESTRLPSMWPLFKSRIDAICGLSLLLVLSLAPRGFSPGTPVFSSPQKPTFSNSNSIWNARTHLNDFIWTPKCFMGKKAKKKSEQKLHLSATPRTTLLFINNS